MSPPPRREPPEHRPASRGRRERVPTIAILLAALAAAIVTAVVVANPESPSSNPGDLIFIGTEVASWPEGGPPLDYRTPFPPYNEGDGPCHDPQFTLELTTPTEHVYRTGEAMAVNVRYDAPGCKTLKVTFGIRHVPGSPRHRFYCPDATATRTPTSYADVCTDGFGGAIGSNIVDLTSPSGVVTLTAQPGTFPPAELASVPDLDGAQLCSVGVRVSDGIPDGSSSFQGINVACPEGWD